jgi:hypothetical protein
MLTPNDIKERLEDRNLMEVSRRSGVPYMKIYNLIKPISLPRWRTSRRRRLLLG